MTEPMHPRRTIESLSPPPGSFDLVLGRARARRYRRLTTVSGVTGVFLAGIWGGLALGGGVAGVQSTVVGLADRGRQVATPPPSDPATTTAAVGLPSTSSDRPTRRTAPVPVVPTGTEAASRSAMVRGRVADAAGAPVAGMYVYTGTFADGSFVPRSAPSAITGASGRYAVPCTGGPVLLTPWLLNTPLGSAAGVRFGAELETSPSCSRAAGSTVTTVFAGSTVEGHVRTDVGCADTDFSLWLWLDGDRATTVRLANLNEGDAFRVSGLPAGTHVLGAHGRREAVTVDSRSTLEQDVTFTCPEVRTPTASPTPTLSPTPTGTGSPTPSPTGSTPTPTATGSPSPTPTGSTSR